MWKKVCGRAVAKRGGEEVRDQGKKGEGGKAGCCRINAGEAEEREVKRERTGRGSRWGGTEEGEREFQRGRAIMVLH